MSPFPWRRRGRPERTDSVEPDPVAVARLYHERTKHAPMRFARGPYGLDWANQPDPFRRWSGAPEIALERLPRDGDGGGGGPLYTQVYRPGATAPAPLDHRALSRLFFDAFAISAWKEYQGTRWALRVNPSSGNLHPTEVHAVLGPIAGVSETPLVVHYAPSEHVLEVRAELPAGTWAELSRDLPSGALLVGLSSIHWREAWKYGERAWRYCQHDAGHALATLALSAAGLGWRARLADDWSTDDVARLLGLAREEGPEADVADALVVVAPGSLDGRAPATPGEPSRAVLDALPWRGVPSELSPDHVDWDVIDAVALATRKPETHGESGAPPAAAPGEEPPAGPPWRDVVHHRRSAVAMDGKTAMEASDFFNVLRRTLPGAPPFDALAWPPAVDLAVFVHRVEGLERGIYALVRDASRDDALRAALHAAFAWERPAGAGGLPLFLLRSGDVRGLAAHASCDQEIAGAGCFSLGMLADMGELERRGAWMYPRLFWETGAVGQVLYLEAEALGLRGTGIGCFFDDEVHAALGLRDRRFQSLYHFAFGAPVEDGRLTTLPAYPD